MPLAASNHILILSAGAAGLMTARELLRAGKRVTILWFGRNRRLAKDFENLAETLATFVTLASIQLALRRLARAQVGNSTNYRLAMRDGGGPQRVGERTFAGTRGNG